MQQKGKGNNNGYAGKGKWTEARGIGGQTVE